MVHAAPTPLSHTNTHFVASFILLCCLQALVGLLFLIREVLQVRQEISIHAAAAAASPLLLLLYV